MKSHSWYIVDKFKDGQISAEVNTSYVEYHDMFYEDYWVVNINGTTYEDLFIAAAVKDAFDKYWNYAHHFSMNRIVRPKIVLSIRCLISQRSDRRFKEFGSFDLKVVSNFIDMMKYDTVRILDVHSDVVTALIHNSVNVSPGEYIRRAIEDIEFNYYSFNDNLVMVSPDAGAYKKVYSIAEGFNVDLVSSNKVRLHDNQIVINVTGDVKGKLCLIIDDIADGGRTFIELGKRLKELGADKVFLYVTHGMFHFGVDGIMEYIDKIYTTNSYRDLTDYAPKVKQFEI